MKLYSYQNLDYCFVILSPDHNPGLVSHTLRSIRSRHPDSSVTCVAGSTATPADIKELKCYLPTFRAKDTFSSLLNTGFKNAPAEWAFVLTAGTTAQKNMNLRYSVFIEDEKDILFPIASGKYLFPEATVNGLLLNKNTFKKIGFFDDNLSLENSKLLWANDAIDAGCRFKAIANVKLC